MITPQKFALLAAAAVVSVAMAVATYWSTNRWATGRVDGSLLMPDLQRQVAGVGTIEIAQGEKKITLEGAGEQWRIKERAGYPASTERVRALLAALAGTQLVEPRTASKDRYKMLELEDPAAKDAKSRSVRLLDQKGNVLGSVVLGKSRFDAFGSGRGGIYVRRPGEATTWLAAGDPKAGTELRDWASTSLFEIEQSKVSRIEIEHPGETPLVIVKGEGKDQKFALEAMPEGKKLKQGVTIDQIPQGYASIDMEDVRKLEATPAGDKVSVLKLKSAEGLEVVFRLRKEGEASWISLMAKGEGDAKKAADELNARSGGWEFKIPSWKADQIGKRHADLFETS